MPITAADLEDEYREEQVRKAEARANADNQLRESFSTTRTCRFVLFGGVACAMCLILLPTQATLPHLDAPLYDKSHERIDATSSAEVHSRRPSETEPVTMVAKQETRDAENTPGISLDSVPKPIRDLAVKMLGMKSATKFFQESVCTVKYHKRAKLGFWHNSGDRLDFNDGYNFEELKRMPSGSLAVDIGANLGDTAVLVHFENPRLRVMSMEPSPHNFIYVKWNILHNRVVELTEPDFNEGKAGVLPIWGGATKDGRRIELAFSPQHTKLAQMKSDDMGFGFEVPPSIDSSGAHQLEKRYAGDWQTFKVESFSLVEWFKAHDVTSIKWFKLDCEGCEYETLIDLENSGFLKGAYVMGEAHYRHVPDLSCKSKPDDIQCRRMISQMMEVRKLMCGKYKFSCCAKMMHCGLFQEKCETKGKR